MPSLSQIESLIAQSKYEQALTELDALTPSHEEQGEALYFRGRALEQSGDWPAACEAYEQAATADETHLEAVFRLAYLLDLHGEEELAIELYERCVSDPPLHVNTLLNLAVLYEDDERFDDAARCLKLVLSEHPNHARARLFLKDVDSSMTMFYDEDQERIREQRDAILDIAVTDFELSVRSRNCLKQMNINTLGDLLKVTEVQLMTYKNFGETSLTEIKAMLTQKGLHLGQLLEEQGLEQAEPDATQPPSLGTTGVYARPVSELELSVRSRKCLQRLGISTLGELAARSEGELLAIKNFGQTSLNEIKRRLAEMGLSLRS